MNPASKGAIPGVDHTEFMIKPPALDIPIDPALNPSDTFQATFLPPGENQYQAVLTLALPDKKGSIVLDTTRLASKKDVKPEKQLFLPKDETAMMRWIVVGVHHVLQNSRKFELPPLQDMFCTRDMNVLTIKVNDKPRDFRLITRANVEPLVKFLNELYAPNSPYLWKEGTEAAPVEAPVETPVVAPVEVTPAPVVAAAPIVKIEVAAPVVKIAVVAPVESPVVAAPAAPIVPEPVVEVAAVAPVAEPEEMAPAAITLPALETGMLFLSKSGSGKLRTVEMVGDFANLYEKEPEGAWAHQREFDPTEMEVFVAWLFDNCDLQAERVGMAEVKG